MSLYFFFKNSSFSETLRKDAKFITGNERNREGDRIPQRARANTRPHLGVVGPGAGGGGEPEVSHSLLSTSHNVRDRRVSVTNC